AARCQLEPFKSNSHSSPWLVTPRIVALLFNYADADIARLCPGFPALYNRVVRNALYIAGMIIEGAFWLWRRSSVNHVIRRNPNVGHVVGRTFGLLGIKIPDAAHIPPPTVPTIAKCVMPATISPSEPTIVNAATESSRARALFHSSLLRSSLLQSYRTPFPLSDGGEWQRD